MTLAQWRDYLALCKPRVVFFLLLTALVGMLLAVPAGVAPPWQVLLLGGLGIACCAAAAAVFNQVLERGPDARMERTRQRPLAARRLKVRGAVYFALALTAIGSALLLVGTNLITLGLTLAALVGYALVYTCWLKPNTPQNIVLGGLSGALPPLLGWTAVTGRLDAEPLLLVLIVFVWTPPHFWALALHRRRDYEAAGIPMLPVTHGEAYTSLHILLYSLLLLGASLLPFAVGLSGFLYLSGALLLGGMFLFRAFALWRGSTRYGAMQLFYFSLWYLPLLFSLLLLDHYLVWWF